MWDISVLLQTHHITQIVIGYPSKQLNIQKRIDAFVVELSCITELPIVRIDEDSKTRMEASTIPAAAEEDFQASIFCEISEI